jgi:hypothetical protein
MPRPVVPPRLTRGELVAGCVPVGALLHASVWVARRGAARVGFLTEGLGTPDSSSFSTESSRSSCTSEPPGRWRTVRGDQLPGEQPHTLPGRVLRRSAARVEASPARHAARHRGPGGSRGTRLRGQARLSARAPSLRPPHRAACFGLFVPERARRGLDGTLRRAGVPPCARPQVKRARVGCFRVAGLLIGAIGLANLYLGAHYLSNVLAGFSLGLGWTTLCVLLIGLARMHLRGNVTGPRSSASADLRCCRSAVSPDTSSSPSARSNQPSHAVVPLAGSRQLALSVLDAEVPDEGDRVALGISDGG